MVKYFLQKYPTNLYIVVYGSFFYFLHAQVTEHIAFAMVQIGEIKFTPQNFFFNFISKEVSAQITLPAIFLKAGFNKYLLSFFLSWLFTLIPFIATWQFAKNSKSPYIFFLLFTSLLICFQIPNWYFYPYSIQLGFYAFGNIGFWIFILFFGLLLQRKSNAYLISGLLVSIHIPWGILSIFFLAIDQVRNGISKKLLKSFLYGICISGILLVLSSNFINSIQLSEAQPGLIEKVYKSIKPIKLTYEQYPFYAFDPFVWNNSHNPFIFYSGIAQALIILFNLFLPSFLINIRVRDRYLDKFRNQIAFYINFLSILVLIGLTYMELARIFPLPFVDILWRLIINRYLNAASFVSLIFIAIYLFHSTFYNSEKPSATFFVFLSSFIYLFNFVDLALYLIVSISVLFIVFAFYKSQIGLFIKRFIVLAAFAPIVYTANLPLSNLYTTLVYLDSNDPIFNYLEKNQSKDILLGPHVQSNNGLDVSLISGKAFYVMSEMNYSKNGEEKSVYCYKKNIDYKSLVANAETCFQERAREDWEKIFEQLNISSVIVFNRNKLNLDLVAKNRIFSIYSIDVLSK